MALWNSHAIWNRGGNEGGFTWNSSKFLFIVRINETLNFVENISETLARLVLTEKPIQFYETLVNTAFYGKLTEEFKMADETPAVSLLFQLAEKIGFKDDFTDFIVKLFLEDKQEALDDIKLLVEILESEDFDLNEITSIQAFVNMLEKYNLHDLKAETMNELFLHEGDFGLTDRDAKSAISDFIVGAINSDDKAYDWLEPFHLLVDWGGSEIQAMPESESASIELPGVDGSIIQDTVYKDRLFTLMCYSEDGLTIPQKEDLKRKITKILDTTKNQHKTLTIQANSTQFDVKYLGKAEIASGPSFISAKIPFHADPYGKSLFPYELYGSGLVSNLDGDAPLRVKHIIKGPITNPSFTLGGISYSWNGTVPSGSSLIISHDNYTCYIEDNFKNKRNVLQYLTGEFQSVPPGKSIVLTASANTERRIITQWSTSVLW